MPVCGAGKADTALHRHARFLAQQKPVDFKASLPLHFPMYTLPLAQLMELTEVEPHEVLQSKGLLVEFEESLGRAAFVSHQWVGKKHPDPEFKQLRVLQDALEYAMADMRHISLDLNTEFLVPGVECLDTRVLRERSLFIWYDYFSCPQLDFHARKAVLQEGFGQQSQLASAIGKHSSLCWEMLLLLRALSGRLQSEPLHGFHADQLVWQGMVPCCFSAC